MGLIRDAIKFWKSPFRVRTLEEVMLDQACQAQEEEAQCMKVITSHRFQQHMARAKLDAIQAWRQQEGLTGAAVQRV